MQRAGWILLVVIVVGAGAFLVSYTFKKSRPDIPIDDVHVGARGQSALCLTCHGLGGIKPRSPSHPAGRGNCEQCHYWRGEAR